MNDDLMRTGEVSEELGISDQTVRRLARSGQIATSRTDRGHRRFRREDVLRYKKALELERLELGARAAKFFASEPRPQHLISLTVPQPDTTIDDWIAENPDADEEFLRKLYSAAKRQAESIEYVKKHLDLENMAAMARQVREQASPITDAPRLADSIRRVIDPHRETLQHVAQSVASIYGAMEPHIRTHRQTMTSLEQALLPVVEARKRLEESIATIVETLGPTLEHLSFLTSKLLEQAREYLKIDEATTEAFRACGWPIAPSMPIELKLSVLDFHEQDNKRGASLAILGYYRRNGCAALEQVVEEWATQPHFADRMSIIRDALWAHKIGKYTLSVPAVVVQIEGVLADFLADPKLYGRPKSLSKTFIADPEEYGFLQRGMATALLESLVMNEYSWIDFPEEGKRRPHLRPVGRNSISHGLTTAYAKESYSLRCFLILDAISLLMKIKSKEES